MTPSRRLRTAWIDPDSAELHVAGRIRSQRDFGYALHESELAHVTATDARHALINDLAYNSFVVSNGALEWIDEDFPRSAEVMFEVEGGDLRVRVAMEIAGDYDEEALNESLKPLLAELLRRHRARLIVAEYDEGYSGEPPYPVEIVLSGVTRGRTLHDWYQLTLEVRALVAAVDGVSMTRASVLDLLRAGQGQVLVGQPESSWLDAKKTPYDLSSISGKISLAQSVARFANGEDGGLVVFGLGTRVRGSGEVIAKVHPVTTDGNTVRRHQQAIEKHLYPVPAGMTFEIVPVEGGDLLVAHVPVQPEASKPFLVHGAIVADKIEGAFISIVRRHGEDSIPITASAVHAAMSMNRLLDRLGVREHQGDA